MIYSENPRPELACFAKLMHSSDCFLNKDAKRRPEYYSKRIGQLLEDDVFYSVQECAKGTAFEGSIKLVSGASFPDIVAHGFYGIEVKSTIKNHWTSIGSSIYESTRIDGVERIFLTFGKLGAPIEFLSRPYEECMSEILVTHYPRYKIDMHTERGKTIFDKMNISYDELRKLENPVSRVSEYYRGNLKPGERLWWASDIESASPATLRIWSSISKAERNSLIIQGLVRFPEIVSGDYSRFAFWLVTDLSIVCTNIRDLFSAGGKFSYKMNNGKTIKLPAVFRRIFENKNEIKRILKDIDIPKGNDVSKIYPSIDDLISSCDEFKESRSQVLESWCRVVLDCASVNRDGLKSSEIQSCLNSMFS